MTRILVVDDEAKWRDLIRGELEDLGYGVMTAENGEHALQLFADGEEFDLLLTDLKMEPVNGLALMRRVREISPGTDVVMITAYADTQTAVEALRLGAYDFLIKPFELEELALMVRRVDERRGLEAENRTLRRFVEGGEAGVMVGESAGMRAIHDLVARVAPTEAIVLVRGESGTGKELVARAIHDRSPRAGGPFKAVNCAALPETLLESELFGHERGSFTGADRRKIGLFEAASGGSLFLDEIGEISGSVQAKLLRVLEMREITRIGSTDAIKVNTRVIAATHVDLEGAIREGVFRPDLYYRLNVFPIELPPLRARKEDIERLARRFLADLRPGENARLSQAVLERLKSYDWPGNVRELRNVIERATILAGGASLGVEHIVLPVIEPLRETVASRTLSMADAGGSSKAGSVRSAGGSDRGAGGDGLHLPPAGVELEELEARLIREALVRSQGNKSQAARLLGITRRALYCRMEKHGIGGGGAGEAGEGAE